MPNETAPETTPNPEPQQIAVQFVNNAEGGYIRNESVPEGTTIGQFFAEKMPNVEGNPADPAQFTIRVNRQECASGQVLQPNDRVSVTPVKVAGASAAQTGAHLLI